MLLKVVFSLLAHLLHSLILNYYFFHSKPFCSVQTFERIYQYATAGLSFRFQTWDNWLTDVCLPSLSKFSPWSSAESFSVDKCPPILLTGNYTDYSISKGCSISSGLALACPVRSSAPWLVQLGPDSCAWESGPSVGFGQRNSPRKSLLSHWIISLHHQYLRKFTAAIYSERWPCSTLSSYSVRYWTGPEAGQEQTEKHKLKRRRLKYWPFVHFESTAQGWIIWPKLLMIYLLQPSYLIIAY